MPGGSFPALLPATWANLLSSGVRAEQVGEGEVRPGNSIFRIEAAAAGCNKAAPALDKAAHRVALRARHRREIRQNQQGEACAIPFEVIGVNREIRDARA